MIRRAHHHIRRHRHRYALGVVLLTGAALLGALWFAPPASAAPVTANPLTVGADTANRSVYTTGSISPSANNLILLGVVLRETGGFPPTPTISGNGLTWVPVVQNQFDAAGTYTSSYLYRAMGTLPSAGTISINVGQTVNSAVWQVTEFGNVNTGGTNGSVAIVQAQTNAGQGSPASVSFGSFSNVENTTYSLMGRGVAGSITPGAGFTELGETVADNGVIQTQWKNTNDTTADTTFSGTNDWGMIGVEIAAAGVGAGGGITFVRSGGIGIGSNSFSMDIGSPGSDRLVVIIADDETDVAVNTQASIDGKVCNFVTRAVNTVGIGNTQEMWYCDEGDLGASSGVVTIVVDQVDTDWAVHAHLYTGVDQGGPSDFGIDTTSASVNTVTVSGITVPARGLVVMGAGHGEADTISGWTSPLIQRTNGPNPGSGKLATASAIESLVQNNKTYVATWSGPHNRGTGIVAVWSEVSVGGLFAPTLSSPTYGNVTTTSADMGATIDSDGGTAVTERGTCWGTGPAPTGNCLAEGVTGLGAFSHNRTGLPSSSTIYYRGYADNAKGRGYSPDDSFPTLGTGGGFAVVRAQTPKIGAQGTVSSATFSPTTQGNLLVAISAHRQDGFTPIISPAAGWNMAFSDCYALSGCPNGSPSSSYRRGLAVWYKIADGSESLVKTSWSPGSNNGLILQEFKIVGGGTFTFDRQTSSNSAMGVVPSWTTETTTPSSQADSFLVTAMGSRNLGGPASWSNDVSTPDNFYFDASGSGSTIGMNTSFGVSTMQGPKESTATWAPPGSSVQATAGIAVFSLAGAAPPSMPTVDLKGKSTAAVSGDGPISITSGNNVTLEWSSTYAAQCDASGGWSGTKALSGTETINNVVANTIFTLNCSNVSESDIDSFTANILVASLSANPTGGIAPLNSVDLTATAGGTSSGTYRYFFNCNNGSPDIDTGDIALSQYTESAACNYDSAGNYDPTVTIWHSEGTAQATTPITVSSDLSPTIINVLNDGPVDEGQVITFDVTWTDVEGIGSGYLVICKDPDPGAPLSDTWPPQCQSGYWNDAPPVAVSGTGATTQIQYTTQTGDAPSNTSGWAYVCQAQNECNPSSGASNTVFTINAPASNDDLLAINLSAPSSTYYINDTFAYVLTVTNNGFGDTTIAMNVFVQVTLPSEVAIENPIPSSCTPLPLAGDTGISVSCDMGTLGIPGAFKTEFFNVTAKTEKVNSIATAELTGSLPEDNSPPLGNSSNNTDMAIVTIVDPFATPNAIPTLNSQYRESGGPFASGPPVFWDDSITSVVDLDVTVDGETTITLTDPATASGTLISRPIDSRAFNGVAPYKLSFRGDLPDTERDPAFFLRNAMYNPTTGLIGTNCEDLPINAPYDDNCTASGDPSGEWRVGVDFVTGRYGGTITAPFIDPWLDKTGQGWAWSDSVGWIAFSCDTPKFDSFGNPTGFAGNCATENDWHVEEDTAVPLAVNRPVTGWAWSPVIGWVAFGCDAPGLVGACDPGGIWDRGDGNDGTPGNDSVWVDENGIYHGWAWSSMVGWISMNCNESPAPYNTCAVGGPLARSASGGYSQVQVSIAASRCPHAETDPPNCETPGTWIYSAPYTFNDIGNLGGGNFEIDLADDLAALWNTRYVRYQMTLCSFPDCGLLGTPNAPTIKGVSVLWAP